MAADNRKTDVLNPGGDWADIGKNYEALRRQTGAIIGLIQQSFPRYFRAPNIST
jgi:hypothetical protein